MKDTSLPRVDHILRHVKGRQFDSKTGGINGEAFKRRQKDSDGLSVYWLECFAELDHRGQLQEIRRRCRLTRTKTHRFAKLNVGTLLENLRVEQPLLDVVRDPLPATADYEEDPSHSLITGLPDALDERAGLIGDMIACCVEKTYPAL